MSADPVLDAALAFHRAGIAPMRAKIDGSKAPAGGYEWQKAPRPSEAQVIQEFTGYPGLGIRTGNISGALEMLEFEGRAVEEGLLERAEAAIGGSNKGALWMRIKNEGYWEYSPSGGVHFYWHLTDMPVPGNTALARRPAREDELTDRERVVLLEHPRKVFPRTLIETRSEGGFSIVAPSHGTTHPSGKPWEVGHGSPGNIARITSKDRKALFTIFRTLDLMPRVNRIISARAGMAEDEWEAGIDWPDILEPHGYHIVGGRADGAVYWSHPGSKSGAHGLTTGVGRNGDLYVFTTACELEENIWYSKAEAYAVLNNSGDTELAREQLGLRGNLRTIILAGRNEAELTDEISRTMEAANRETPSIFQHGTEYAEIVGTEFNPVTPLTLGYMASRSIQFSGINRQGQFSIVGSPKEIMSGIIQGRRLTGLNVVDRIMQVPFFTPSGRLWNNTGYCEEAHVFYRPTIAIPPIPLEPDDKTVAQAKGLIEHMICDIPFIGAVDKAVWYSMMLLPFVRDMIPGVVPLYDNEAPRAGTGKTLSVKLAFAPAYGEISLGVFPSTEEELEKVMLSKLRAGAGVIVFDNITETVQDGKLNAMLTSNVYDGRLLGGNTILTVPNRAIWVMTGNNPRFGRDLVRRIVVSRQDTGLENPEVGRVFVEPEVEAWARKNRAGLVSAALVLIQRWIALGMPAGSETLGSFEDWSRVMGGVCEYVLGLGSPLGNREALRAERDTEGGAWIAFIDGWLAWIERGEEGQRGARREAARAAQLLEEVVDKNEIAGLHIKTEGSDRARATSLGMILKGNMNGVVLRNSEKKDSGDNAIPGSAKTYRINSRMLDGITRYSLEER